MQQNRAGQTWLLWILAILFLCLIGAVVYGGWYGWEKITALSQRIGYLEASMATTTLELQKSLAETHSTLSSALEEEQQKAMALETQFGTVADSVNVLQKLSELDPELLKKYSKVYFLNENYKPAQLAVIQKEDTYREDNDYTILPEVLPYLESMIKKAKRSGIEIYVQSAYRSFDEQQSLKGQYRVVYGAGTANQFSADQGYSEHQLGTTVDLITTGLNGQLIGFERTPAYEWLKQNAYHYGFTLSYPSGNGYYIFEPWHWRFVGVKLATHLNNTDEHFYDLDQREIDSYLINIFDSR